ncbi:hypothetical protein FIBSPDRAFT_857211, partial [Athelia psychrophila]
MASDYRLGDRGGRGDLGEELRAELGLPPEGPRGRGVMSVALLVLSFSYARVEVMWETNLFAM